MIGLIAVLASVAPIVAQTPASAPAEDLFQAQVARLVRQLNDPQPPRRRSAADALLNLGEQCIPIIEKLTPSQSAEAQLAIEQVLRDIRASATGVLVLLVVPTGQAAERMIRPGAVLLSVDGRPIRSLKSWSEDEHREYRNRPRRARIREGPRVRNVDFDPGAYGIYCCEFRAGVGDHLVAAAAAFARAEHKAAATALDSAVKDGWKLEKDDTVLGMYVHAQLYARPAAEREDWLNAFLSGPGMRDRLSAILDFGRMAYPEDHYPASLIAKWLIAHAPQSSRGHDILAWRYTHRLDRPAEGLVEAVSGARLAQFADLGTLLVIGCALDELRADAELAEVLERIAGRPDWHDSFMYVSPAALRLKRYDLCEKVLPGIVQRQCEAGNVPDTGPDEGLAPAHRVLCAAYMLQDKREEYRSVLAGVLETRYWPLFPELFGAYWAEVAPLWDRSVRKTLGRGSPEPRVLNSWIRPLMAQVEPDTTTISSLIDQYDNGQNDLDQGTVYRARLYFLEGNYEASIKTFAQVLERHGSHTYWQAIFEVPSTLEAARFLKEHVSSLTGNRERWKRTQYVFPATDGTRYLVTRDVRIARADAGAREIREIPLPEPGWWPLRLSASLVVSPSGKTVLTNSRERVFLLNADARGWTQISTLPVADHEWGLMDLGRWADPLAEALRKRQGHAASIVLPLYHQLGNPNPQPFMLGDGTWLYGQAEPWAFIDLNVALDKALGRKLRIYDCFRQMDASGLFFMATEAGMYCWNPDRNKARLIPMPEGPAAPPVMFLTEKKPPRSYARFVAAFPEVGGAIAEIDVPNAKLKATTRVNSLLPVSFWRGRTAAERLEIAKAAMKGAGLDWQDVQRVIRLPATAPASAPQE